MDIQWWFYLPVVISVVCLIGYYSGDVACLWMDITVEISLLSMNGLSYLREHRIDCLRFYLIGIIICVWLGPSGIHDLWNGACLSPDSLTGTCSRHHLLPGAGNSLSKHLEIFTFCFHMGPFHWCLCRSLYFDFGLCTLVQIYITRKHFVCFPFLLLCVCV